MSGIMKWNVRTPKIEDLERVLNELSEGGWYIIKISAPIFHEESVFQEEGIFVMVIASMTITEDLGT
jgi:hypothetical protein